MNTTFHRISVNVHLSVFWVRIAHDIHQLGSVTWLIWNAVQPRIKKINEYKLQITLIIDRKCLIKIISLIIDLNRLLNLN